MLRLHLCRHSKYMCSKLRPRQARTTFSKCRPRRTWAAFNDHMDPQTLHKRVLWVKRRAPLQNDKEKHATRVGSFVAHEGHGTQRRVVLFQQLKLKFQEFELGGQARHQHVNTRASCGACFLHVTATRPREASWQHGRGADVRARATRMLDGRTFAKKLIARRVRDMLFAIVLHALKATRGKRVTTQPAVCLHHEREPETLR